MVGIPRRFAANTTGTVTKPPFEKTTSGLSLLSNLLACVYPFTTLKGS